MPIQKGIGYGDYTGIKIEHLSKIMAMHIAITQAVIKKHASYYDPEYRYIDLTAGMGSTPDGNKGSPIVFLDKAGESRSAFRFRADFIERDPSNLGKLQSAALSHSMGGRGTLNFHPGEYQNVIPQLLKSKRDTELGLIYVDPTGTKDLPDIDTLALISSMRPRMEILFYLSATGVKRQFQQTHSMLADFLNATGKQHWLIRRPFRGDKHQWTFLLGSNSDFFKPYKSIRSSFYLLDSPEGQQAFEKMNLNQEQRIEQKQSRFDWF